MMTIKGKCFFGNEVSSYGLEHGYVDYYTLAKAFDAILNNDIISQTNGIIGYWEQESGYIDNSELIEELSKKLEGLEDTITKDSCYEEIEEIRREIDDLQTQIEELEYEQDEQPEIYQWYIVSDKGAEILKAAEEIVYYNSQLDMYLWGVTHYGTSWSSVLTNIKIDK